MTTADINSKAASEEGSIYDACAAQFGPALVCLAAAYEADPHLRRDLLQDIHAALWRSLHLFDNRCSLRTWAFRVAHNTASSYVATFIHRCSRGWVSLEAAESVPSTDNTEEDANRQQMLDRLMAFVQTLRPIDKQIVLLYLEGLNAAQIAEVIGISAGNAATKIHRIKTILSRQFKGANRP